MENEDIALELYRFLTDDYTKLDMRSSITYASPPFMLNQLHRLVATLRITEDRLQRVKLSPQPGGDADKLSL